MPLKWCDHGLQYNTTSVKYCSLFVFRCSLAVQSDQPRLVASKLEYQPTIGCWWRPSSACCCWISRRHGQQPTATEWWAAGMLWQQDHLVVLTMKRTSDIVSSVERCPTTEEFTVDAVTETKRSPCFAIIWCFEQFIPGSLLFYSLILCPAVILLFHQTCVSHMYR